MLIDTVTFIICLFRVLLTIVSINVVLFVAWFGLITGFAMYYSLLYSINSTCCNKYAIYGHLIT